jgi:hypothetical protein
VLQNVLYGIQNSPKFILVAPSSQPLPESDGADAIDFPNWTVKWLINLTACEAAAIRCFKQLNIPRKMRSFASG